MEVQQETVQSQSKEAEMQRKIMELEAELAKNKPVEEFKDPFAGMASADTDKEDAETRLVNLKARAKELGVKGFALPHMTEAKLVAAIEEAESKLA